MRSRELRWVLALAGVAVLAGVAFVFWPQPDRITEEKFERIQKGMSRAEVDATLGPAGDYSSGPLELARGSLVYQSFRGRHYPAGDFLPSSRVNMRDAAAERVEWRSDNQIVCVYFLDSGYVHTKSCHDVARSDQSRLDNLLWRVKRLWQRWFPEP